LTGTCLGDSGGPLVAHRAHRDRVRQGGRRMADADSPVLVGVVSWGVGCQDFTVFTRVSAFSDWIKAAIAAHERRNPVGPRPAARR
jgi:secreted trypsin-like serine protease